MIPAIFLDRDGVIVENVDTYILSWSDVQIYPQALDALVKVGETDFKIVIITNQSAVGRGLMLLEDANLINQRLVNIIAQSGGRVDGIYMCQHSPVDRCSCRKPLPGLLLRAAEDHSIDFSQSIIIGDAWTDLLAGQAVGIPQKVLVRTGRGELQYQMPVPSELGPYLLYDTLADALMDLVL
jgi:histidinol-phosphate phosphatase family protein